jgi:hypothetical protein
VLIAHERQQGTPTNTRNLYLDLLGAVGVLKVFDRTNQMKRITISQEKLRKLYVDFGLTAAEVAIRLGCSESTVRRYTRDFDLWKNQNKIRAANRV